MLNRGTNYRVIDEVLHKTEPKIELNLAKGIGWRKSKW